MRDHSGDKCQWDFNPQAESDLKSLQTILNCASIQGCGECVPCSERALDLFRKAARGPAATKPDKP